MEARGSHEMDCSVHLCLPGFRLQSNGITLVPECHQQNHLDLDSSFPLSLSNLLSIMPWFMCKWFFNEVQVGAIWPQIKHLRTRIPLTWLQARTAVVLESYYTSHDESASSSPDAVGAHGECPPPALKPAVSLLGAEKCADTGVSLLKHRYALQFCHQVHFALPISFNSINVGNCALESFGSSHMVYSYVSARSMTTVQFIISWGCRSVNWIWYMSWGPIQIDAIMCTLKANRANCLQLQIPCIQERVVAIPNSFWKDEN